MTVGQQREILLAVTFREFDGGPNAKIHERFLESLKEQTYQNFRLIVTNFREKTVRAAIEKSGLRHEFIQSPTDCRLAFTERIENAFPFLERGKHILLVCNCDFVFDNNFFQEVVDTFEAGCGAVSYPAYNYRTIEDYERGMPFELKKRTRLASWTEMDPNLYIIDLITLDGDIFLDERNRREFTENRFVEHWPGYGFTIVLGSFAREIRNLFFHSRIHNILNDRQGDDFIKRLLKKKNLDGSRADEVINDYYSMKHFDQGYAALANFCRVRGVPESLQHGPYKKLNLNRQFKPLGTPAQLAAYGAYFMFWTVYARARFALHALSEKVDYRVERVKKHLRSP